MRAAKAIVREHSTAHTAAAKNARLTLSLRMASTASSAKCSLQLERILLDSVVCAMLMRSLRKATGSAEWSSDMPSRAVRAVSTALR